MGHLGTKAHAWLLRRTRGRVLARMGGRPVLLLTTTGARSGEPRQTPVQYLEDGDRLVLVASAAGAPRPPQWWRNARATPEVEVAWCGRYVAREAEGEERARLWAALIAATPQLPALEAKAGRRFPVVVLEPR